MKEIKINLTETCFHNLESILKESNFHNVEEMITIAIDNFIQFQDCRQMKSCSNCNNIMLDIKSMDVTKSYCEKCAMELFGFKI